MPTHHQINYLEFQAENLDVIKKFYKSAFGWKLTDYGPEYTSFNDGRMEGGFSKGKVFGTGTPLVIIYSENLEVSLKTIAEHGGKIVRPTYSFPGGQRFHFTDPAGNELAVWSDK